MKEFKKIRLVADQPKKIEPEVAQEEGVTEVAEETPKKQQKEKKNLLIINSW